VKVFRPKSLVFEWLWSITHHIENQSVTSPIPLKELDNLAEKCHKNGRLERDLELKPLVDIAKEIANKWDNHFVDIQRLSVIIKKLPALEDK